jgi:urease accessory protein
VRLEAAPRGGRTALVQLACSGPLRVLRAHYLDPALPDMAFVTVCSTGGGVLQGDRLEVEARAGAGARLSLGTAAATRLYAMPRGHAESRLRIRVAAGAYVEHVPDPYIPYAGSRFLQEGEHEVAETGALVVGEVIAPGRAARGESLAYGLFAGHLRVRRPSGALLFQDASRLDPARELGRPGLLGRHRSLGSLYAVAAGLDPEALGAAAEPAAGAGAYVGASELPNAAGAWVRVLADDARAAAAGVVAAWEAARLTLLAAPVPPSRRY